MKNIFYKIVLFSLATSCAFGQLPIAQKMAQTIMKQYPDSMVVAKYASHLEQDKLIKDGQTVEQAQKSRPANWNYEIGVVMMGFENLWRTTGDVTYLNYLKHIVDKFINEDGSIRTYEMEEYNSDNIPTGRQLLTLYQTYKDKKYKIAADLLRQQIAWQPRNKAGGFWHKLKYPSQMWLDGLYMVEPFYAEYAQMNGNNADFDDIANQFITMEKQSIDPKTGLLIHGWDESKVQKWANKIDGKSPEYWSRAMGWYIMALVDVLDYFPKEHAKRKELIAILNRLSATLTKFQDPTSGVWWQVTNKGGMAGNYLESSSSAMFVYGMAKAVRMGYLPDNYTVTVNKGFEGILKTFVETDADGTVHYTKAVAGAGLGGKPYRDGSYDYYINEPQRKDDLKAIGPFIQACVELDLSKNQFGKGKTVLLDYFFNNEHQAETGIQYHYTWEDRFNSGFSWWGEVFNQAGVTTKSLTVAPTAQNLKNVDAYIIVDPDSKKENSSPNYISKTNVQVISDWVKSGGTLILMANDTANCETKHFNELAQVFGIKFTDKSINMVKNNQFEQGKVIVPGNHAIFKNVQKAYVKELSVLELKGNAKSVLSDANNVIMAVINFGKGSVFAIGDPWLYNEYVNGHKLPAEYENFKAMKDLTKWILVKP